MQTFFPIIFCSLTGWITCLLVIYAFKKFIRSRENQTKLTAQLADVIATDSSLLKAIQDKLSNPAVMERMKPLIEAHVDLFLKDKIAEAFPLISKFIGDKTRLQFKAAFMNEIETLFPTLLDHYMAGMQKDLDPGALITRTFAELPKEKLDNVIQSAVAGKLLVLQIIAIIIGAAIGGIQMLIK